MFYTLINTLLAILSLALCEDVCCPDLDCMSTDPPFNHLPAPKCPRDLNMVFGLHTRRNKKDMVEFVHDSDIPDIYIKGKRTIFVLHGYQNSKESGYMVDIKDALLEREDANVILVCWKELASSIWYPNSASNTRTVGAETAYMIRRMQKEVALTSEQTWCIGFSLGAHGCAFTGQRADMGRITALDPAGPWFDGQEIDARISEDDADLVDVIHTDGWGVVAYYGMLTPVGDIDFYPNAGYYQPGCTTYVNENKTSTPRPDTDDVGYVDWSCSHGRAPKFFLQTIKDSDCFTTESKCSDHNQCAKNVEFKCSGKQCPEMGYNADKNPSLTGMYYLQTASRDPYCNQA